MYVDTLFLILAKLIIIETIMLILSILMCFRYKIQPRDPEAADPLRRDQFDPFRERKVPNPTT